MNLKKHLLGWLAAAFLLSGQSQAAPIILATKGFTEQHILSAMTVQYLQKKGFQVQPQTNIAAVISRNAMLNKQIDVTWEYTGTSLIIYNHINKRMTPEESYATVKKLDARQGLVWLNPADMNNTYAFAMQRERAEAENITTMSEMVAMDAKKFLHRYPKEMSGGQQQRIGVIRALAADPPVLLMDEPFGAVDPINREVIQNQFLEMQRKLKKTVMLVSHDIDEALKLGDRIAVFRQGRIVQCASPDELLAKPANEFVGSFVGQDRTLKRLLLVSAGDVTDQQPTITVRPDTALHEAFGIMDDNDIRAVTVVDSNGKPLGFVKRREARDASGTCADLIHPFRISGKAEDNLRIVLSRLYESNTSWMPIVDEDGRYNGEISQDYIADYLSSGRTRRVLNIHEA